MDDLLLLAETLVDQAMVINKVLSYFYFCSGERVNKTKAQTFAHIMSAKHY